MTYEVQLTKKPTTSDFRSDYFPRKFHYKKDAEELVQEVKDKGGAAVIVKVAMKDTKATCAVCLRKFDRDQLVQIEVEGKQTLVHRLYKDSVSAALYTGHPAPLAFAYQQKGEPTEV